MNKTLTLKLIFFCIGGAALTQAIGHILQGGWLLGLVTLLAGALWAWLETREWKHSASTGLILLTALAAWGMLLGLSLFLMTLSGVLTLAGWDLSRFRHRLQAANADTPVTEIEKAHHRRLAWVCAGGLVLASLGNAIHIQAGFLIEFILGVGALWLTYQVVIRLARLSS